jgi:hypothetical protein
VRLPSANRRSREADAPARKNQSAGPKGGPAAGAPSAMARIDIWDHFREGMREDHITLEVQRRGVQIRPSPARPSIPELNPSRVAGRVPPEPCLLIPDPPIRGQVRC